jgi:hypothetical protein
MSWLACSPKCFHHYGTQQVCWAMSLYTCAWEAFGSNPSTHWRFPWFEMWCWRWSWTDLVYNEAVLHRVKEERNILHTIRQRKANWIGHMLRRNCLLRHIIEGKIRGTRRRGRRRKQLLDELKEARRYWKWKDHTLWRTQFGRGYGPVARQTATWTWTKHIRGQ